jgi:putative ABC transport system permease protein
MLRRSSIERGFIFRLAFADLWHEKTLSACIVFSLAAVISPLMLMFGLKFGTVETLRVRLIQDPANRELRPVSSVSRPRDWFNSFRKRPGVGFLVPTIRQIAATVSIKTNAGTKTDIDLIPSGFGDRLLLENEIQIPQFGELVLTALAARELNVQTNDEVSVIVTRSRGAEAERFSARARVSGTLPMRSNGLKAAFVCLEFLESVEAYKDGFAVPQLGVEGELPLAYPEYDGAVVIISDKLTEERKLSLIIDTGLSKIDELQNEQTCAMTGWSVSDHHYVYLLKCGESTIREDSIAALREQLRGSGAEVLPWVKPQMVSLEGPGQNSSESIQVFGLSVAPQLADRIGMRPAPPWGDSVVDVRQILKPASMQNSPSIVLNVKDGGGDLNFPIEVVGSIADGAQAVVPVGLAGILRLSKLRGIRFDSGLGKFLLERRAYSGFRMYADSIENVEPLRAALLEEGINTHTEAQRIAEVKELDQQLTMIFWLIAVVGLTGALAALVASLYASVQRKRRELGILRLIGLTGRHLMRFPVYQSSLCVSGSFLLAALFFQLISESINRLFRGHLESGESFCRLPFTMILSAFGFVLLIGIIAAAFAAIKINQASAADAMRDE